MAAQWWSFAIGILAVCGIWTVGTYRMQGWILGATSNVLVVLYGIVHSQYGFMVFTPLAIAAQVTHMWRWRKTGWQHISPHTQCHCKEGAKA